MQNSFLCDEVVLKVASRCNINCTYCYMYNKGDTSYLGQPKFMEPRVYKAFFERVRNHCEQNNLTYFFVSIHGGEPLLTGKKYLQEFIECGRSILAGIDLRFSLQTNGILLDHEWCDLFEKYKVSVGISIDVSEASHNAFRIDHRGKGTYNETIKGLRVIQQHPYMKNHYGALSVIDINADPDSVFDHFDSLGITSIDLLMPDNNYVDLPPGMNHNYSQKRFKTPYANWLIRIFDRWIQENNRLKIRMFASIVKLILGQKAGNDAFGNHSPKLVVVETDGGIEPVDSLKICGPQFTKLGLNVGTHELDSIFFTDLYQKYYYGKIMLPKQCQACPISEVCGGGFLPNRFSQVNGFDNPSVYCLDLLKLITHIQNRILEQFSETEKIEMNVAPLSFEDALSCFQGKSLSSLNA